MICIALPLRQIEKQQSGQLIEVGLDGCTRRESSQRHVTCRASLFTVKVGIIQVIQLTFMKCSSAI